MQAYHDNPCQTDDLNNPANRFSEPPPFGNDKPLSSGYDGRQTEFSGLIEFARASGQHLTIVPPAHEAEKFNARSIRRHPCRRIDRNSLCSGRGGEVGAWQD